MTGTSDTAVENLSKDIADFADAVEEVTGAGLMRLPAGFVGGLARALADQGYERADPNHYVDPYGLHHPPQCDRQRDQAGCMIRDALLARESPLPTDGRYQVQFTGDHELEFEKVS